jgi:hypothetical protein
LRYFFRVKNRQRGLITFQATPDVMAALDAAAAAMGGRGARTRIINDACRQILPQLLRERVESIQKVERELRLGKKTGEPKG